MRVKSQTDLNSLIGGQPKTPTQHKLVDAFRATQEEASKTKKPPQPKSKANGNPRRSDAEGEEQTVLVELFEFEYPHIAHLLIHIPNGGSRKNAFEGYRLKRQGVKAGVSDLLLPVARQGYHGLWIEFKATPPNDAAVTNSQKVWLEEMLAQGYQAALCKGVDEAMEVFRNYLQS